MRFLISAVLFCGTMLFSGCSNLVSVEPLGSEAEGVFDQTLIGAWSDGKDAVYLVRADGERAYSVTWQDDGHIVRLRGILFRIGGESVLDLVAEQPSLFSVACHAFVRVQPADGGMEIRFLDSKWLRARAAEAGLARLTTSDRIDVLTGPGAQLRAFIGRYGLDEQAMSEPELLTRLGR